MSPGVLESVAFATPGGWLGVLVIALLAIALIVALRLRLGALRTATGPGGTRLSRSATERRRAPGHRGRARRGRPLGPRCPGAHARPCALPGATCPAGAPPRPYRHIPDDVKALALPSLRHRLRLRPEAEMEGVTADSVLTGLLARVPVPR